MIIDLGCMINHAMFQRNGRSGYVLKPMALRHHTPKELLAKRSAHTLHVTVISAQQLPQPRDSSGKEILDKANVDPYVELTLYVPEWPIRPEVKLKDNMRGRSKERNTSSENEDLQFLSPRSITSGTSIPSRAISARTSAVKRNGFNPVWEEKLSIPFECVGDMFDLIFVKFVVKQEDKVTDEPLAVYCASLGCSQNGKCHAPLLILLMVNSPVQVIVTFHCTIRNYPNIYIQPYLWTSTLLIRQRILDLTCAPCPSYSKAQYRQWSREACPTSSIRR